jgi:hypothetical protein
MAAVARWLSALPGIYRLVLLSARKPAGKIADVSHSSAFTVDLKKSVIMVITVDMETSVSYALVTSNGLMG